MITSFALEFPDEPTMRKAVDKLWGKHEISGELEIRPLDEGRWRLQVHSEKQIRESTIESLGGIRVKARSAVTKI